MSRELHEIQRRHRWGALVVYERVNYRRTRLMRYLIERVYGDGAVIGLRDFRTLREAVRFCRTHTLGGGPELDPWTGLLKGTRPPLTESRV